MARDPIPTLETPPIPDYTLHNATKCPLLYKLPEEIRQRIYSYVLHEHSSQVIYIEAQKPGEDLGLDCKFIPEPIERYLHARGTNPWLCVYEMPPPSAYGELRGSDASSIMVELRQRMWNLPQVCRAIYAETWQLGPAPCTFAFPNYTSFRTFQAALDVDAKRHIGGLCVSWRTSQRRMRQMPRLNTVYLWKGDFTPERLAELREFYENFSQVDVVG